MCRSYFFALFACALFSLGALSNAYSNLPGPVIPPVFHLSDSPGNLTTDPIDTSVSIPTSPGETPTLYDNALDVPGETPVFPGEKGVFPGELYAAPEDGPALLSSGHGSSASTVPTDRLPEPSAPSGSASVPRVMPVNAGLNKKAFASQADPSGEYAPKTVLASQESTGKGQPSSRVGAKAASHGLSASPGDAASPLNNLTENFNILLLGVDKEKLEMVCVYSINHHFEDPPKSVSLFFPVNSLLQYKGKKETLDSIYAEGGWQALEEVLEKEMFIDIAYYVKIDRQALRDLEKYFEPIYVDGEKVQMETLFVRRTSNEDDRIIARILKQVLRREVFFRYIPSLVFGINRDIESNFSFTPQNLAFHYQLAKKLSTKRIEKIVLFGTTDWQEGRRVNIPRDEDLGSAIYLATH